jgi:hypothetical protein
MNVELQDHRIIVDMEYFTQQLLSLFTNIKQYPTPAVKECFKLRESPKLDVTGQKTFHTIVAKLLYLAKQARPDILTATSFLCTRVKEPTKNDQQKLLRVIGYLEATKHYRYTISPSKPLGFLAYVHAAFATHEDSKSHSEVAIFIAGVLVYTASKKQACVTKSPIESELVILTDYIGLDELFEEFISFILNDKLPTTIFLQDSTSVVTLVTQGSGVTRTRHLRNRMHLAKEAVDEDRLIIKHCKANLMIADGFTKPLKGSEFQQLCSSLDIYHSSQ